MLNSYSNMIYGFMENEIDSLKDVRDNLSEQIDPVIEVLLHNKGKLVFMGVGKSGLIGRKLAATFSSTGTPSFFVHATESVHGDLGMIGKNDVVILISNSGETKEILAPLKSLNIIGVTTIAFTGNEDSSLAKACDYKVIIHVDNEADKLNLAPTNSSTAVLVVGDAIACTLSETKQFTRDDFAIFHPGGALGKKLLS